MTDDGSGGQLRLPDMWRITHVTDVPPGHPDAKAAAQPPGNRHHAGRDTNKQHNRIGEHTNDRR